MKFRKLHIGLLLAVVFSLGASAAKGDKPQEIKSVRFSKGLRYARVVIETNGELSPELKELPADPVQNLPPRLFVDLTPAIRSKSVPEQLEGQGVLVTRVRVSQFAPRTVRVVVDLKEPATHQLITLYDPYRLVIDIYGTSPAGEAAPVAGTPSHEPPGKEDEIAKLLGAPSERKPATKVPSVRPAASKPLVVIDPGHGGKDPGAIGRKGVKEKDVVLAVSLELASLLRKSGYKVFLTREDDRYLALSERTELANERTSPGDLFVSIHANSSPTRSHSGIETFYWNVAVDRSSASTVARENFTNLESVFKHEVSDLKAILSDLVYKEKERASAALAGHIQRGLIRGVTKKYEDAKDNGVKHGPLYVLALTSMPAVLVETSFLSNRTEEKWLASKAYQQTLARGVFEGIESYLKAGAAPSVP